LPDHGGKKGGRGGGRQGLRVGGRNGGRTELLEVASVLPPSGGEEAGSEADCAGSAEDEVVEFAATAADAEDAATVRPLTTASGCTVYTPKGFSVSRLGPISKGLNTRDCTLKEGRRVKVWISSWAAAYSTMPPSASEQAKVRSNLKDVIETLSSCQGDRAACNEHPLSLLGHVKASQPNL
jgi:hypothetical protein